MTQTGPFTFIAVRAAMADPFTAALNRPSE